MDHLTGEVDWKLYIFSRVDSSNSKVHEFGEKDKTDSGVNILPNDSSCLGKVFFSLREYTTKYYLSPSLRKDISSQQQ